MTKIIFQDKNGNVITEEEIDSSKGTVDYQVVIEGEIDPVARQFHEEGRELGLSMDFDGAIRKFKEAVSVQSDWEYPYYDMAFTYVYKQEFDTALSLFRKADLLYPKGFLMTKEAIYALEGEQSGKFPKGLYLYYKQIELRPGLTETQKLEIATTLTRKAPDFAPGWLAYALLVDDENEHRQAIDMGLTKNPDPTTQGLLMINKAYQMSADGKKGEAINLLGNLVFSKESTTSTVALAKMAMRMIHKENSTKK
jgi:tetratricopeptide (TPR) repeat protein